MVVRCACCGVIMRTEDTECSYGAQDYSVSRRCDYTIVHNVVI